MARQWYYLCIANYIAMPYILLSVAMSLLLHKDQETERSGINKGDILQIWAYPKCFNLATLMMNDERDWSL